MAAQVVLRALQKPLADRFGSALAMADGLEQALRCGSSAEGYDVFINYRVWCEKDFAVRKHPCVLNNMWAKFLCRAVG